ncbi:hypothetical protein FRC04_003237 [Tulasnella sp. 424]|nr:hypothetical protein FRC04_003237 [Tulasnella sp. 424]KAG8965941.1 hypothetical protein FRC05_002932 [Tulasnella sp. 425]
MSDLGRESLTDKASAAIKPDSEKSTTEHVGDKMKGTSDSVASSLQPQSEKSTSQKVGDSMSSNTTNDSLLDQAKDALGLGR